MPAYVNRTAMDFVQTPEHELLAELHRAYAADGFASQYTSQTVAWDMSLGAVKSGLTAAISSGIDLATWHKSEPRLLLDIMGRHLDWSVIVCLVGGGQEINSGENGMAEWGEALRSLATWP